MVAIRQATHDDATWMQNSFVAIGWSKRENYFKILCDQQDNNELVLLVAHDSDAYVGHVKIIWQPNYRYFRENNIPEIQDLAVLPDYRRQGVATRLVDECERRIAERSNIVGIGFGLYVDYAAAQRMYIQRGYLPDGMGVSYKDEYVKPGATVNVDDDLVLHLVKHL